MSPKDKKFIKWKEEVGISDERTGTKAQKHEKNGILRNQLRWCWQIRCDGSSRARSLRVYILCSIVGFIGNPLEVENRHTGSVAQNLANSLLLVIFPCGSEWRSVYHHIILSGALYITASGSVVHSWCLWTLNLLSALS